MKKPIAILGLLIALPAAYGVKTQSISHTAYKEFIAGEFDNVSLSYDGRLNLSSAVEQVVEIEEPIIWAAVADSEGNLYLGTGNAGKVLKVDPEGEVTTVFSPEEILSRALAVDDAGNLYVGTSPIGRVYRIPRSGRPEIYFDPEDTYIWDLAIDDEGNLFVSTGASARIYKLPPDYQPNDEPVIWFECEQSHLTAMAWDNAGHLLVGSSPDGILYRVREEGKGFALFNSESEEIKQIAAGADGKILFSSFNSKKTTGIGRPGKNTAKASTNGDDNMFIVTASSSGKANTSNAVHKNKSGGGSSIVYSIDRNGFVEAYWGLPEANIFSFLGDSSGHLLVGSNDHARVYSVVERGDWRILLQAPDGGEVSLLLKDPNNPEAVLVVTSNPARIYRMGANPAEKGTFKSAVVDASQVARWGSILVDHNGPGEPDYEVATRTGNTGKADDTWADWEKITDTATGGKVASPNGRYLQYKIEFTSPPEGLSAEFQVNRVRVFFQTSNTAPVISAVRIVPLGFKLIDLVTNPPNVDLRKLLDDKNPLKAMPKTQVRRQLKASGEEGLMTIAWNASDANGDALEFRVAIRKESDDAWITLAEDIDVPVVTFNSKGYQEGYYRARVEASDSPDNSPERALTGYRMSDSLLIDNSPPVIKTLLQKTGKGSLRLKFKVEDALSVLLSVAYVLDGQPARSVRPDDGLFDSRAESFSLAVDGIDAGPHSLVLKAYDENGKGGVLSVPLEVD